MAADITISPFTTEVLADNTTTVAIQLYIVREPVQIIQGGEGGSGGSSRPVSGLVYPRLVG
jgi:GTPase involved in cell partitioning and DNA repair